MKNLGFKKSLLLVITSLLIMALFITGLFSYLLLKQNATDNLISRVESSINFESKVIQSYIQQHSLPANALADLYEIYNYRTGHEKLAEVAAKSSGVTKITIGFDDGSSFVSRPSQATFPGGIGIKEKYDPRTRAWYQHGKAKQQLSLIDVFFTKENVPIFGATHAISGGVVLADIRLGQLQEILENVDIMDGSVGMILDQNGMILASTAEYAAVKSLLKDIPQYADYAASILSQSKSFYEANINGANALLFSKRFDLIDDAKMFLVITLDSKTAFAPLIKQTSSLLTTMFIILVVFSIIIVTFLSYLYKPVIELRDLVQSLSAGEGDLTQRLRVKSADDLGQIARGINDFIEALQNNMLNIKTLTGGLSSGVDALQNQTENSSKILSQHVVQTNSVASSMLDLGTSAEQVADNAIEAAEFVANANSMGESSRKIILSAQKSIDILVNDVDVAAKYVENMSKETNDINSVLSVIGSIAEQTNLLALNAAIEAARAGEQGRGFAVVADEVRALAARTQQSTGEIESSLTKLSSGADSVVSAIKHTKDTSQATAKDVHKISISMEDLLNQVTQVNQVTSDISMSAKEQNTVIHDISHSMTNIHSMVEELTSSGKNITQETDSISNVNHSLTSIVNKFKLEK